MVAELVVVLTTLRLVTVWCVCGLGMKRSTMEMATNVHVAGKPWTSTFNSLITTYETHFSLIVSGQQLAPTNIL